MATYDKMSAEERQRLMDALGSLTGLQAGPNGQLPDGTHYEYDPDLKTTVEVTASGERFPVVLVEGINTNHRGQSKQAAGRGGFRCKKRSARPGTGQADLLDRRGMDGG